jgi:hypothetical protein
MFYGTILNPKTQGRHMSVFKRKLEEGEVFEDTRFAALNTQVPAFVDAVETAPEVVAPKATKKEKEKEVEVAPVVEPVAEVAPEVTDEKPLDTVVG